MNPTIRSACVACIASSVLWAAAPAGAGAESTEGTEGAVGAPGLANPFFPMETGIKDAKHSTPEAQADMLKDLGYPGTDHMGFAGLREKLQALDARALKLFAVYVGATIDGDPRYDPALRSGVEALRGRDAVLWVFLQSRKHKPSAPEGDPLAVEVVRELADIASGAGLRVALYPHVDFWLERVEDAVRVADKVERKNVGATFNLCHFLKVDREENLFPRLAAAIPRLTMVSVNGADPGGPSWKELIQTLDRGSFDNARLLSTLEALGYRGPVALQGYGIGGDVHENLKRSLEAWRRISARAAGAGADLLAPGLAAWREPRGEWLIAGKASLDPRDEGRLASEPGSGVAINGARGSTANLISRLEHGDVEAHVEFLVPRGSSSGVYFQGRYEIQVLDSFGAKDPKHSDCGGIYERWAGGRGFEGRPPRSNASRPPGEWQTFDVVFRAPRFDASGKKTANAVFVKVAHNGTVVHEDQEVTGPTRAAAFEDERPAGPLMLQGDHGPVAYRNIRVRPIGSGAGADAAPGAGR
ncbi:MAG: DUF1080 domain-containing protein [Planctomycetes bacterium]|nr:DUF1080 domain-containing protein [Planctomycetota bacterium]